MSPKVLRVLAALAVLGGTAWWLVAHDGGGGGGAEPAPAPKSIAASVAGVTQPLPTLSVKLDAGVTLKLRGPAPQTGCATEGLTEPLCPGQYDVRAEGPGLLGLGVIRLERGEHRELDLPLERPTTVELVVLDDEREPVDRATVIAQHVRTGYLLKGRTDSDGTVSLGPAIAGDWLVLAQRDGWAPGAATAAAGGRSTTVRLGNLGVVEGTLEPKAPGAHFELATPEHVVVAQGTTSDAGFFRLGPVPQGRYELVLRDEEFETRAESVTVPASGLVFKSSTGATLKGDLLGPAREKLSGTVTLEGPDGLRRTVVADGGTFVARALTPGRWRLASGEGRATAVIAGGVQRIELLVPKYEGVIAGTCGFDGGHRLPASLTVRATSEDGQRVALSTCDAGRFELTGLPRGFYALDAEASEGAERWAGPITTVSTGTRDLHFDVPGVAWLAYRIVGENGSPLAAEQRREHFESRDVELTLRSSGHVPLTRVASLQRGSDTLLGDLALKHGEALSGRVLDAVTKDPVAGATVSVGGYEHVTKADGTFSSSEAPEGDVELRTSHPKYVSELRAAEAPGEVSIELQHAARAVGALITADGSAPHDVEVWAISPSGVTLTVPVEQGAFHSPHLSDGHWLFRVMPIGPDAEVSAFDTAELDIKGPGDRPVSLVERLAGLSFEVQVVDREGGPMPSSLLLVPRKEPAPQNDEYFTRLLQRPGLWADPTGTKARYRFAHVPPGAYTVLASAQGRVWTAAMPVSVQQGMGPLRLQFEQVPYSP